MKIIKKILATVLVVCVLVANMQGFTAKATEVVEGSYDVFEVKVSPKTELVAGEQFLLDVEIRNTSKMNFSSLRFINVWYHADEETGGIGLGVLEDVNNKGVEIEQQAPVDIAFAAGESRQFELGGSLPSSWNQESYIAIVVSGQLENVNYYGQGGIPEGAVLSEEEAFEVFIDGPDKVESGEELVLDVEVKNKSKHNLTATELDAYYCEGLDEDGNPSWWSSFGDVYDSEGQIAIENAENLTFAPGETKNFQIKGVLPFPWTENHMIYMEVESVVGRKTYDSTSEYFQVICENQEPGTGGDTEYEVKEGFEVVFQGPKEIAPGKEITFDVSVKNISGKARELNYLDIWYFQDRDNWEHSSVKEFGALLDENGNDAYLNPDNFIYKENENKKYTIVGTVPDTWNKQSMFVVFLGSVDEYGEYFGQGFYCLHAGETEIKGAVTPTREQAGYTGDTYCLVCEQKIVEGKVIDKLVTEVKEDKVEGNLEATVKVDADITLPGDVIFVAEEVTKTIDIEEKAKIEKTIDSKVLKEVTDNHKIAAVLDLKLILRDNEEEIKYEPDGTVEVTVQVPKNVLEGYENIVLLHIKDDGTIEVVPFELNSGDKATFKTDGFSYYVFVGTEKTVDNQVQTVPSNNNKTTDDSTQTVSPVTQAPKTGDSSFTALWLVVMLFALMGILVAIGKKNKFNR